ncbi:hypothetical protein HMI55_005964 [Coelomomyces lativittatus]|nr:hypothetical protein HMI55_005964 [Coelomomyces lativittatus]
MLAGSDRLERDKALTIGQMQGKFQVQFYHTGHAIQEDSPTEVATSLLEFVHRYTQPILPKFPSTMTSPTGEIKNSPHSNSSSLSSKNKLGSPPLR